MGGWKDTKFGEKGRSSRLGKSWGMEGEYDQNTVYEIFKELIFFKVRPCVKIITQKVRGNTRCLLMASCVYPNTCTHAHMS